MKTGRLQRFVRVDSDFLELPEIQDTIAELKGNGLTMVIMLMERLLYRKHTIGLIKNLGMTAAKVGVQRRTLISMLCRCPVFRVDLERGYFYAPRLRKKFGLPTEVSEEEVADILSNGNIYYGSGEKSAKNDNKNENKTKSFSNHSQKQASQLPDNQQKQGFRYKDIDKDISNRNIEIESNRELKDNSPCVTDAADAEEFKKILSSPRWLSAVQILTGINLTDPQTLTIFSGWMSDYCTSMQKRLRDVQDVRSYAASLLRKDTRTRTQFDHYLSSRLQELERQKLNPPHSQYESVVAGMRCTKSGQFIPVNAPFPERDGLWFSYIQHRWLPRADYDPVKEEAYLQKKIEEDEGYMRRM